MRCAIVEPENGKFFVSSEFKFNCSIYWLHYNETRLISFFFDESELRMCNLHEPKDEARSVNNTKSSECIEPKYFLLYK